MFNYFKSILSTENDRDPGFVRLVRIVLVVSTVAPAVIAIVVALTLKKANLWASVGVIATLAVLSGFSLFLTYRNVLWPGKVVLPLAILVGVTFLALNANGLHDSSIVAFTIVIILASLISGQKTIPIATVITLLGVWTVAYADIAGINQSPLASRTAWDDVTVVSVIQIIAAASLNGLMTRLNSALEASRANEQAQIKSNQELRELQAALEQRVVERTHSLELASEVGRAVSEVRALDVMLKDAAELIRKQFDLYYVQVYLTDPSQTYLNLQAGTGQVGEQLLARKHRLPLNTASINGRAAIEKKPAVISHTTTSATFKPNPLLPDTRSEMAVPLMIGQRVVGVLDMQSEHAGSLNQEVLSAFEALAGQLAIAIQNATFLAETNQAHAEMEKQAARQSRTNWTEYLDAIHKPEETGFLFEQNKITPLTNAQQTQTAGNDNALVAPISVTGETVGNLVVEMEGQSPVSRISELLDTVARQVSQQIESLRLLDSAERYRAEAEEASRRLTHEGWEDYMNTKSGTGLSYVYDLKEVRPYDQNKDQHNQQAEGFAHSLPLKIHDETIGKLIVQGLRADDSEALELANAVAERLSAHIEGLRLSRQTEQALSETKKQAQREQALRQITSAVRSSTDPATILRTAARELGNILGRQTVIQMATASTDSAASTNEPGLSAKLSNADGGNE